MFVDAKLPTELQGVNLAGADMSKRDLSRHNLTGANLTGANLSGCVLTGAILANAVLTGKWLDCSNMRCNALCRRQAADRAADILQAPICPNAIYRATTSLART